MEAHDATSWLEFFLDGVATIADEGLDRLRVGTELDDAGRTRT